MLITILNWIYFTITFWVLGSGLIALWNKAIKQSIILTWVDSVLIGFCLSLIFALWSSIFFPLDITIQITYTILVLLVLAVLAWTKELKLPKFERPKNWLLIGLIAVTFLLIFTNSLNRPVNPDSGIYHTQTIRWIETYPVVPGLANIHTRLGFNSSWLVVNALFSFHQIFSVSLHLLPGYLFFIVCTALIQKAGIAYKTGKILPSLFALIAVVLLFETNISQASSPGTDLPAILLVVYLCFMSLLWFLGEQKSPLEELLIVFLTFTVITIKLSAAPVILFFVWILIQNVRRKQWQKVGWVFVLAGMVFIPWCIRSVVMTGYLVYPIPFPDIFNFDWKIPAEHLIIEQDVIRSWGKMPAVDFNIVKDLPFIAWAKPWFFDFSLNRKIILIIVFLSPLFLPLLLLKTVRKGLTNSGVRALLVTGGIGYAGLLYWFFSAPDIRFGYTFIVPLLSLIIAFLALIFFVIFKKFISARFIFSGVAVLTLFFTSQMFVRSINSNMINQYGIYPADYPSLPTYPCKIYNKTILCAELYNECWYAPFPCIPTPKPQAVMRGEDFRSGFRLKN